MVAANKIKLSDYLINFLENVGIKHAFLIPGGGNIHIIDSIGKSKKIKYICNTHEQSSAIAAESYSRLTGNIGLCIVTSGPGGTNAITGVMGAWVDSIPMIIISGQIKRETIGAGKGVRQLGDQEINIIDIVKPITKYAAVVMNPQDIRYHLEKAFYIAKSGRPGPVWLDLPLDIQAAKVDTGKLTSFKSAEIKIAGEKGIEKSVFDVIEKIRRAKRPALLIGNGVRLAHAEKAIMELINKLKIPILTGFVGYDLVSSENPYFAGRPGTVGQRSGNFVLQNSDLLLVIGSRLNIRMIGYSYESVAREAYKIMVDIDKEEINKKTIKMDMKLNYDAGNFIREMNKQLINSPLDLKMSPWIKKMNHWKKKYPATLKEYWDQKKFTSPYCFIDTLSKYLKGDDIIAVSNASAVVCTYQALKFKQGLRVIANSGCAAMGYGLPAAVGACFANNKKQVICIEGDGSIQMNISELQTIVYHKLPIKIFIYNNDGYVSIRLTQNTFFNRKYVATDYATGVSCPDFIKIAKAYGIKSEKIENNTQLNGKIKTVLAYKGPVLCEIMVSPNQEFHPKAASQQLPDGSFVSQPLENMYPFLSRAELKENMLIPLLDEK